MTVETKELVRAFKYNSVELPDPGPQYTIEQVRDLYAATYPEIVSAAVEGPEEKDGKLVYTFRRAVGTKGCAETSYVNCQPTTRGRVVAFCCCCGRRSRPTKPDADGEPCLWEMGRGWSEAPYPHEFKHDDGSVGSTFTCPECNARLRAGEALSMRNYGPNKDRPSVLVRHIQ